MEFILECRNFLTSFWICGCGADIANCLDGSLEFWKSNAEDGLEVGAQIPVWRLLKGMFLFQWKTPQLTAERASWGVPWLKCRIGGHCRGDPSYIGGISGKEGEFSYLLFSGGSRNSLFNGPGVSCSRWWEGFGISTAGIPFPEPFWNQCTMCSRSGISSGSILESRIRVVSQCSVYCGLEVNVSEIIFLPSSCGSLWSSIEEMFLKALRGSSLHPFWSKVIRMSHVAGIH